MLDSTMTKTTAARWAFIHHRERNYLNHFNFSTHESVRSVTMVEVIALSPTPPSRDSSFLSLDDGYHEKFMHSISALFDDVIEPSETIVDKSKFMDSLRDIMTNDLFLNASTQSLTLNDLDDAFLCQSSDEPASATSTTKSNTLSSSRSRVDDSEFQSSLKNLMSSFSDIITNQRAFTVKECESVKREIVRLGVLRRRMSESERWGPDLSGFPGSAHKSSKEFGKRRALNLEKQKQQLACILAADVKGWKEEELPSNFADEERRRLREYIEQKYGMEQASKTEGGKKRSVRRSIRPTSALTRIDEDGTKSPMTPRNRGRFGIRSGDIRRRSLSTPRVEHSSREIDRSLSPRRRQAEHIEGKSALTSVAVTPPRERLSVRPVDEPITSRSRHATSTERSRHPAPPASPRNRTPLSSRHNRSVASPRSSTSRHSRGDMHSSRHDTKTGTLPAPPLCAERVNHAVSPRRANRPQIKRSVDHSDYSDHSTTHRSFSAEPNHGEKTKRVVGGEAYHSPRRSAFSRALDNRITPSSDHGAIPTSVRRSSGTSLSTTRNQRQESCSSVGGAPILPVSEPRSHLSSLTNHLSRSTRRRGRSCSRSVHSMRSAATGTSGSTAASPRRKVRGHSLGASSHTSDRLSRTLQKKKTSICSSASYASGGASTVASSSSERRFEVSSYDDTTPKTPRRRGSTTISSVGTSTGATVARDNRTRRVTRQSRDSPPRFDTSDTKSTKGETIRGTAGDPASPRKSNRAN